MRLILRRRVTKAREHQMNGKTKRSTDDEQYGAIETGDGDTVIYDRANERAWLQSSHTVDIEA